MKNKVKKLLLEVSKYMQPKDEINIWNRDGQIEVQYCPHGNVPTNYILKKSKTEDENEDKYSLSEISGAWYESYGEYLKDDYEGFLKLLTKKQEQRV